jgi:uncharacterized protein (TIGR02996 family)
MADYDNLLQAVLDHPSDDAPRLVMADYLDENGEPLRAEFIRTQIAMAQCKTRSKKYKSLCVKERELWDAKGKDDWVFSFNETATLFPHGRHEILHQDSYDRLPLINPEFATPLIPSGYSAGFFRPMLAWRRGFVYYYCDTFDDLRAKLPKLMAFHPITHAVPINKHPAEHASPAHDGPFIWSQIPPTLRALLPVTDAYSTLPEDLIDTRLNFAFDHPTEAILTLSMALVDEAKKKRDKIRATGQSAEQ